MAESQLTGRQGPGKTCRYNTTYPLIHTQLTLSQTTDLKRRERVSITVNSMLQSEWIIKECR